MNKKIFYISGILVFLILVFWLASPLFFNKTVNEEINLEGSEILLEGQFIDADSFHKTEGEVKIVEVDNELILSLEDFQTTNGPDLYVYLSTDKEATDFVDLGRLKGNIGNQNYKVKQEVDFEKYNHVLIWCKAFGVLFGSSEISQN